MKVGSIERRLFSWMCMVYNRKTKVIWRHSHKISFLRYVNRIRANISLFYDLSFIWLPTSFVVDIDSWYRSERVSWEKFTFRIEQSLLRWKLLSHFILFCLWFTRQMHMMVSIVVSFFENQYLWSIDGSVEFLLTVWLTTISIQNFQMMRILVIRERKSHLEVLKSRLTIRVFLSLC